MNAHQTELLAPAGSSNSLRAAVRAGADAVYLGAEAFNARRGAENFTLDTLAEACDYAHLRGVSVYLTLNTAVLPSELHDAMELARQAWRRGVDAFIVQDIGIASEIARSLPEARIHASTQMNIHSEAGIDATAALGASRITLARELSLQEVARLSAYARERSLETEVFAHGALCVCYSGQCFMSSLIGGRSANRGLCAQACRLPYELHNKAQRKPLDAPGEHLLSTKDLCTVDMLPDLVAAQVASLKIEGRMKSAEYVASVTGVYRRALDAALAAAGGGEVLGGTEALARAAAPAATCPTTSATTHATATRAAAPTVSEADHRELAEAFSRGFTTAYLERERGNQMMSYGRPNNRGVFVGRVTEVRKGRVRIALDEPIAENDVLEFWTNKGHVTQTVSGLEELAHKDVTLPVQHRVNKGDRVFRVRRAPAAAGRDDAFEPRIPVSGSVVLRRDEPLRMSFATPDGVTASVEGPVVEAARTKAVTTEEVREHVDRLGNLPFYLTDLTVDVDEGAAIGFSKLHKLRTSALTQLQEMLLAPWRERRLPRVQPRAALPTKRGGACCVVAYVTNPACARAAKRAGADEIYVSALNYKRGEAVIAGQLSETAEQAGYPKQTTLVLPAVAHDLAEGSREADVGFDPWRYVKPGHSVLAGNIGQLLQAIELGAAPELDSHVPVLNRYALDVACALGARRVWLSPELSLAQIKELARETPVPLGISIIGAQELMVTEHCILMSQGSCNERCSDCIRRKSPHYLKDRKGYEFPVITDCCGRSHLYNAVPLDIAHAVSDLMAAGVTAFMVDTTLLNVEETNRAVQRAVRARDLAVRGAGSVAKAEGTTSGHLYRGVS